jgi:RNA polymerase sigma factor (sigma-70 family)
MKDASDRDLLDRFVAGRDEAAFAELVSRHGPLVMGVCRRVLGNAQDAEDAFQAAFIVLSKKAPSIRTLDSVSSWLHRVAFRIAIRAKSLAAERRTRERRIAEMAQTPIDSPQEALPVLRPVIDEELSGLPEKYRAPLVLCYLEGKTNEGAARILGWPIGTMSRRLEKARELLRGRLVGRGVAVTGAALAALLMEKTALAATVAPALAASTAKIALLTAAGEAAVSAPVALLVQGGLKALFAAQLKVAGAAVIAVSLLGTAAAVGTYQALKPAAVADAPGYSAAEADRLDRRLAELQPTAAERKIDLIGWAPDLLTAVRLSKEHGRPVFLVVHDGSLATGRFDGGAHGLRAVSLADDRVISLLNRCFVPVFISNEDIEGAGSASAAERAEHTRIYHAALAANLPAGSGAVYAVAPEGTVLGSLTVPRAHDSAAMLALLDRFKGREGSPLVKPAPLSKPPAHRADDLVLHAVSRYVDKNGAPETYRPTYHELPAENWIVLDRSEWARLLPSGSELDHEWIPAADVAAKILRRFYPVTEDNRREDVDRSRVERISLRARIVSIREGSVRARLEGQVRMQRYFHAIHPPEHRPELVSADVSGFLDFEPSGRILSLKLTTVRASYGPSPFAVALRSK